MGSSVYFCVLCLFTMFDTLHGEMYFEPENEAVIRHRCQPGLFCYPTQHDWAELEHRMTGTLVFRDSLNYTIYNYHWNLRAERFPMVHAVCKNVEDIQLAVRFAKKHNLHVKIKSSGFDVAGRSTAHNSFTINLMEMKYISVNTEATDRSEHGEVTVETGVNTRTLYEEVEKHNRIIMAGNCHGVSPGGYLSGGGLGRFAPTLGLGVDNVLEIKVVLADGRVATCTHNKTIIEDNGLIETHNNGELFWALRGGGGGTFGVVVYYVLKLHPSQSGYVSGIMRVSLFKNESDRAIVKNGLDAFTGWVETTPNYWGGSFVFVPGAIFGLFAKLGLWDANTESEIRPLLDFQSRSHHQVTFEISNTTTSVDAVVLDNASSKRSFGTEALINPGSTDSAGVWDFVIQSVMDLHADDVWFSCSVSKLGGKVAEYGVTSASVHPGFRRAQFNLKYSFKAPKDHELSSVMEQERLIPLVAQFAEKLRTFQVGQYINQAYIPSPDWKIDFWGEHYVDLLKVKIRYDPDNLFTCHHCVGSDYNVYVKPASASVRLRLQHVLILLCAVLIPMTYTSGILLCV